MKIGILTFHNTPNYGATLQAYALSQAIKKQGCDVEFIDYQPYKLVKEYSKYLYWNFYLLNNIIKSWKRRKFLLTYMHLSQIKYCTSSELKNCNYQYDLIICGSDEIWNISSPFTGFDQTYFLNFIYNKNIRKVSYAASFGSTIDLDSNTSKISGLLQDFSAISVRDTNSLKLVTNNCNLQATKVLDPTFLVDYTEVMSVPKIKNDYILVYGGLSVEERNYVKALAEAENLDIISIGYPCKTARVNLLGVGPDEWLGFFFKASYVFTNFYHGVIFSIIFKKPFTVFGRTDKSIKVRDLLSMLDLSERSLEKNSLAEIELKLSWDIDFNSIHIKLNGMIQESIAFLSKALNNEPN